MINSTLVFLRKHSNILIYTLIFLFSTVLIKLELPKYMALLHLLLLVFLLDFVYLKYWSKYLSLKSKLVRIILYIFHWFPYALLLSFLYGLTQKNIGDWQAFLRTYLLGSIVIILLPRVIMGIVFVIYEAIHYIYVLFCKKASKKKERSLKFILGVKLTGVILLVFFIYSSTVTVFNLRTEKIDLRNVQKIERGRDKMQYQYEKDAINRIPDGLKGYKIVQFSDLHIGSFFNEKYIDKLVERILSLDPDIIVFTGDMVNFTTTELVQHIESLSKLKAKDGIYIIKGNHDYGDYVSWHSAEEKEKNNAHLEEIYKNMGWIYLNNNSVWITKNGDSIRLVGVENWGKGKRFPKKGDIEYALSQTPFTMDSVSVARGDKRLYNNIYTVLLSHDPSHFDSVVNIEYPQIDLCLSGHTHGMQMGFRFNGIDYTLARRLYYHDAGLFTKQGGQRLYVSTGAGFNGLPFRIGIRPSITLLEL